MRRRKALFIAMFFGLTTTAYADQCESWTHKAYPVTMEACSYDNGGSGYYKITNDGNQNASVCWSVVSSSGKKDKGCNSNLKAGESTKGSCFQCGSKNEGVQYILLESYKVR